LAKTSFSVAPQIRLLKLITPLILRPESKFGQFRNSHLPATQSALSSVSFQRVSISLNLRGARMKDSSLHLQTIANQDGAVILNSSAGTITTLNSTGAFVWRGLQSGESADTIARDLSRTTDEDPNVIRSDVAEFVDAMKKGKLLTC
jgi:hypothetical protein